MKPVSELVPGDVLVMHRYISGEKLALLITCYRQGMQLNVKFLFDNKVYVETWSNYGSACVISI